MDSHVSEVSSNGVHMAVDVANMHTANGVDDFIHEQYSEEPPCAYLPLVSERLAETITHWCRNVPDREKIRNMFKTTLVLDLILKLEKMLMSQVQCQVDEGKIIVSEDRPDAQTTGTNTVVFDVKKVHLLIDQSVKALSICNSIFLQKRKTGLKSSLDRKYHYLTKLSNKVTDELLGSDLEQQISDCNKILSAARKISFTPNCGQNRCGGGHFNYTSNYTNYRKFSSQSNSQVRRHENF